MNENEVLAQHRPWLLRTARGIGRKTNGSIGTDDLVQEGWIAMWKAMHNYDPSRGPIEMWLKANARWRMKDLVRKRISILEDADDDLNGMADDHRELQTTNGDIEDAYHDHQIVAAINRLTDGQRDYVYRRFWLDQTERQMKEHFGYTPTGMWYSAKNGARMKLRTELQHLRSERG